MRFHAVYVTNRKVLLVNDISKESIKPATITFPISLIYKDYHQSFVIYG